MNSPLRVVDGKKFATFDGLILEVFGVSGRMDSQRIPVNLIEKLDVVGAGEEWMFIVKTHQSGFSLVISAEKKNEWEQLAREVQKALSSI